MSCVVCGRCACGAADAFGVNVDNIGTKLAVSSFKREVAAEGRIAELERAAETTRAEHAAAMGLATARIRELEGERDRALDALRDEEKKTYAEKRETHAARLERDELLGLVKRWKKTPASERLWADTDAIVARTEKATK